MEQVFCQMNVVKLKLGNRISAELVNAILNIRTALKRDNVLKHVMIVTEIPKAVTMGILLALVWYAMKTILLKVVSR